MNLHATPESQVDERLLTFAVSGAPFAVPISGILEVVEVTAGISSVPALPPELGGVINYHGDALPIVYCSVLLELDAPAGDEPHRFILVVTDRGAVPRQLGLPVERVLGLVDGPAAIARGPGAVAERRSINGRTTGVLDPERLVARARDMIEQAMERDAVERVAPGENPPIGGM